jgi:hypothetical protein
MTTEKTEPYSKVEFDAAIAALSEQAAILDALTDRTIHEPRTAVSRATGPLTVALHDSCQSVTLLVENDHIRDAFVTARTALLTAINACFIFAEGEPMGARAHRHALQKGIRDLDRELNAGGLKLTLKWAGADAAKSAPDFSSLLQEFTTSRGKEQKHWTTETIEQQIAAISRKYGERLAGFMLVAMMVIYRHASEIAHGTLFGEWWHLGFTPPGPYPQTRDDLNLGPRGRASLMMACLSFCVYSVVSISAKEYPHLRDLQQRSDEAIKKLVEVFVPSRAR